MTTSNDIPEFDPASVTVPEGKVHLFDLGGKRYYMDEFVKPNITFAYLRDVRKRGSDVAIANLIYETMGEEAMDALADADDMSREDAKALMAIVQKHAVGQVENLTGK
jgi:hypothetical protein